MKILQESQILTVHVTTALINLCMAEISTKKRQALKPFQEQWKELIGIKKAAEE